MKNPFVKKDNSGKWITVLVISAIAAGVYTYLYFTDKAQEEAEAAAEARERATNYMKTRSPKKKKHTTDLHDLEDIVEHLHDHHD